MAVVWKKLAYAVDCILKSLLTEQGDIIYASGVATPAALPHGDAGKFLKTQGHGANPVWDTVAVGAHNLNDHDPADGAVDFNLQQATDLVVKTVANEAALPVADLAVGELCFATAELSLHICTSAA